MAPLRGKVFGEVVALWLCVLVVIRLIVIAVEGLGLHDVFLVLVPILFMYAPVWMCQVRGVDSYDYPLALPAFRDTRAYARAFKLAAFVSAVVVAPWLILYHYWQTAWLPGSLELICDYGALCGIRAPAASFSWTLPSEPVKLVGYHLFFVAIPEEFFYRGYLQTRLDEAFEPKWRVFGAQLGWGWLITCIIFAFGHSIIQVQWWHFAIFFPSLIFGWMRARTGGIVAGALFHAWANITAATLDTMYGVIPL
jgi:membrane protease YdiL (CAAX protease family)